MHNYTFTILLFSPDDTTFIQKDELKRKNETEHPWRKTAPNCRTHIWCFVFFFFTFGGLLCAV